MPVRFAKYTGKDERLGPHARWKYTEGNFSDPFVSMSDGALILLEDLLSGKLALEEVRAAHGELVKSDLPRESRVLLKVFTITKIDEDTPPPFSPPPPPTKGFGPH